MLQHLGVLAVCACVGVSVGCDRVTAPSPPPSVPQFSTITAGFSGRVINADAGGPVGNVRVSVQNVQFDGPRPAGWVDSKDTATSGEDGNFAVAANLPSSWSSVSLRLTGPAGYDDTYTDFWPRTIAADRPAIRMYPTLVIRPGESIRVRVEGIEQCGWGGEAGECRRVLVAASPGEPVELEIVPDDSSKPMALSPDNYLGAYAPMRRLMAPPGGFPYIIGGGTATLTARR